VRYRSEGKRTAAKRKLIRALAVVMAAASILFPGSPAFASVGVFTAAKLTLSDPRPSQTSVTYTFTFTTATAATLKCITYDFWDTAIGTSLPAGMGFGSVNKGTFTGTGITNGNWGAPTFSSPTVKTTNSTGDAVGASVVVTTPLTLITNPNTATTFYVRVQDFTDTGCSLPAGSNDTVTLAAPTTASTLISATINPTLSFAVAGLGNGATVKGAITTENGGGALNCATSTATAVSFPANMSINTNYTCGQSLTTSTNAQGGYSVTLRGTHASGDFLKGTPTTLTITDGTGSNATPAAFGTPTEEFAYTSSDALLSSGTPARFSADDTFAKVGNNSATTEEVAWNGGPVNAEVINIAYKIRFSGTTEASTYTGTVLYTCTATF
jgi:hypothetical protein